MVISLGGGSSIQHKRRFFAPDHVNDIADSRLMGSVAGDQQPFFLPVDDLPNDEQLDSAQEGVLTVHTTEPTTLPIFTLLYL